MIRDEKIEKNKEVSKYNQKLTPENLAALGMALGDYMGNEGKLAVASDFYMGSKILKMAFMSGALNSGSDIFDLDCIPVPFLKFIINKFSLDGGIIFYNNDNLNKKNCFKIYDSKGIELTKKKINDISNFYGFNGNYVDNRNIGKIEYFHGLDKLYLEELSKNIEKELFIPNKLTVIADCANGPIGNILPSALNYFNIKSLLINNNKPILNCPRSITNSIRNISKLMGAIDANLGVIFDSIGEKFLLFNENGDYIDFTDLAILLISELVEEGGTNLLLTDNSDSINLNGINKMVNQTLTKGSIYLKTIYSVLKAIDKNIKPEECETIEFLKNILISDSILIILKLCEITIKKNLPLGELLQKIPKRVTYRKAISLDINCINNYQRKIENYILQYHPNCEIYDTLIGLKLNFGNDKGWVDIYPHKFENIVYFNADLKDRKFVQELFMILEEILCKRDKS
ncbi:MAG: hypothetical protein ACFFDN_31350 [Candidatus Hodarchaeota archaeon]